MNNFTETLTFKWKDIFNLSAGRIDISMRHDLMIFKKVDANMEFTLITGRTIDQGCGKEYGKFSDEYLMNVAVCEMNPDDMRRLNIKDGDNIRVTTEMGSVIVKAKKSRRIKTAGIIFIPYGPWANAVLKPETEGTGMPLLKGVKANVEHTEDEVSNLEDLLVKAYGSSKGIQSEG